MNSVGFLLSLLAFLFAPFAFAQQTSQPAARFHVHVRLVNVFVNVTDSHGAPIPNLTRGDFALSEDGIPQKIAYFERDTSMPLSIVLAIDTSGSVFKDFSVEKRAASDFIHALLRPVDRLDLIEFNSDVEEVVPFTNNLRQIDHGLDHLTGGPATAFYNAVWLASKRLAPLSGRKVLLIISDGGDTVGGTTYPQALDEAVRGEVMIYSVIDVPIIADAGRNIGGEHAMISLSQGTGGRYYYIQKGGLVKAFQQIAEDLRTQYLIGYYPAPHRSESDFRRIHVALTPQAGSTASSYTLRYRPGYYEPPSPPLDQ